jgi:hypothetical protein
MLQERFPDLKIQVIQNLSYEEYKEVISRAKWALTFGEGLDGYFVEPIFSGSISFSVFNSSFFTYDFKCLQTIYDDYRVLIDKMWTDINSLDNPDEYARYQSKQFALCAKYYKYDEYLTNLKAFYNGDYTHK